MHVDPGGQSTLVVDDARAAVAEEKPARRGKTKRRHVGKISRHRRAPRGHTQVRPPHVRTEIHSVEDGGAVCGPWVVAAVEVHRSDVPELESLEDRARAVSNSQL